MAEFARRFPTMSSDNRPWIAGPDQAPDVARLLCEFRDWWGNTEPDYDGMLDSVLHIMEGQEGEYLLAALPDAMTADNPVGVAQLRYRWSVWTTGYDCWLEDLYVSESARGVGIGRALVLGAADRAASRGCRRIELDVNEDNTAACALYAACGFDFEPKPPGRTLFIGRKLR
jgi:ribosomal protein S18 acetylase RimI-like enzyme